MTGHYIHALLGVSALALLIVACAPVLAAL